VVISLSSIVTAFDSQTIGTKVLNPCSFWEVTEKAVGNHDFSSDRIPGQGYILIPEAIPFVSGGTGKNVDDTSCYVLRSHRGKVHAYLNRKYAAPVTSVALVVYTVEAYLNDPDINETLGEAARIKAQDPTHVLVAILASCGPSTLSPYRFVKNLAGGNHEALAWSADEIRAKAQEIAANTDEWSLVAD
jgi:hypothetical protein